MKIDLEKQLKRQLPEKKEKQDQVKQMAIKALLGFFIIMLALTLLSRMADSMTTPEATVGQPKTDRIEQKVEATGTLKAKDEESMEVESGLLVKEIFVQEGDRVEAGGPLLELDAKDIEEKLETAKDDLKKLSLRFQQLELNENFSVEETPTEVAKKKIERLEQDKLDLIEKETIKVNRQEEKIKQAEKDLEQAQDDLLAIKEDSIEDQLKKAQEEMVEAEKNLGTQKYERDKAIKRAETALKEAKENLWLLAGQGDATHALQALERAQMEYEMTKSDWDRNVKEAESKLKKAKEKVQQLENGELDETQIKQELEKIKQLEKQVEEQRIILEDTLSSQKQAISDIDRQIADAKKGLEDAEQQEVKNELKEEQSAQKELIEKQLMELDIESKRKEISKLEQIIGQGGMIKAPGNGMITKVNVQKGATTTGGDLLTFVGDESEYVLEVEVSSAESEYIQIGDPVEVTLEGEKRPLEDTVIDNIVHIPGNTNGKKKVSIIVPKGMPHMSATMKVVKGSEKYYNVLPIEALREDNGNYYVFVARNNTTTLGEQIVAERVDVMVLDKNQSSVAVEGAFSAQDKVIVRSNKPISAGDRVRLKEQ